MDVVVYPGLDEDARQLVRAYAGCTRAYTGRVKLGGYKIQLDGSPQSRTAWLSRPYEGTDTCGLPRMDDAAAQALVERGGRGPAAAAGPLQRRRGQRTAAAVLGETVCGGPGPAGGRSAPGDDSLPDRAAGSAGPDGRSGDGSLGLCGPCILLGGRTPAQSGPGPGRAYQSLPVDAGGRTAPEPPPGLPGHPARYAPVHLVRRQPSEPHRAGAGPGPADRPLRRLPRRLLGRGPTATTRRTKKAPWSPASGPTWSSWTGTPSPSPPFPCGDLRILATIKDGVEVYRAP